MSHLPVGPPASARRGTRLGSSLGVAIAWILACGPIDFGGDDPPVPGATGSEPVHAQPAQPVTSASTEEAPVECDDSMQEPRASGCALRTIACGETIESSNAGQARNFDDSFYRSKFCTPRSADYGESPEAVFALTVPAEMKADVYLETPCDDLDLFSIRWSSTARCPSTSTSTGECEGSTKGSEDTIRIMAVGRDEKHLVWVDGKNGATGNFRLQVKCHAAR